MRGGGKELFNERSVLVLCDENVLEIYYTIIGLHLTLLKSALKNSYDAKFY